jgi:C4-dicarboxylate-specific signal transduction histidine kinase
MTDENLRLRAALRDLVALSTIPAGWIGIESRTIAAGLADILAGSLDFHFAFVRFLDPTEGLTIDVTSGYATREFLDWLQAQLSTLDESLRQQIIPNIVGFDDSLKSLRGMIIPIGFNAYAGLVAVGSNRSDFPTETDRMLLTVAANHAATAFRSANLIHERRRAEEEVRKARDELETKMTERTAELHRTMAELTHMNRVATAGVLSASTAHEINQPIAATVVNAQAALRFLECEPVDLDEIRQVFGDIIKDGMRAKEIFDRIRSLTKKEPARRDRFEINLAIREVIELTCGEATKNCVTVHTQLGNSLPLIEGDRVQLQQVILNLIINAIQAMDSVGQNNRTLRICSEHTESECVRVAVEDSGPGLPPDRLERLFEPFYTTKPDGMGIGLSICRSIVEAHGGQLSASTNVPYGAIFQFVLPARITCNEGDLGEAS